MAINDLGQREMLESQQDARIVVKYYAHYLQHQDYHNLNLACVPLAKGSTYGIFLVGSCLERPDFRDVDIRCMLPDDHFKVVEPLVNVLNASVSEWLRQRTGLPVDFQFQDFTETNKKHDGKRNAIGIL